MKLVALVGRDSTDDTPGWDDVAVGIQEGSWAIVLTMGLMLLAAFKVGGSAFHRYVDAQIDLMAKMKDTLSGNAAGIAQLQNNDKLYTSQLDQSLDNDKEMQARLIVIEGLARETLKAVESLKK